MATIDDVEQGVCNLLAAALFPGQEYLPGEAATCVAPWAGQSGAADISMNVRLGIGEPTSDEMEQDLASCISNIVIVHISGSVRNCTEFRPRWIRTSCNAPSLTATLGHGLVTFSGVGGAGMVTGVTVEGVCYAYRCQASDSPVTVAAALRQIIPGASGDGCALAVEGVTAANVVADQRAFWSTGQKEAQIQVMIIATPSAPFKTDGPLVRAALTRQVYKLEALTKPDGSLTQFFGLGDGTQARIYGFDERDDDAPDRSDMWKRTISFRTMYDVGVAETQYAVLAPLLIAGTPATRIYWIGNQAPVRGVATDGAGNVLSDAAGNMLGIL